LVKKKCGFPDLTGNVIVVLLFQLKENEKKERKKGDAF